MPGKSPSHASHKSGVLLLPEAIEELIVSGYLANVLNQNPASFDINAPDVLIDCGFRTRGWNKYASWPFTSAVLLVRPFCQRPLPDMPRIDSRDHLVTYLGIELALCSLGLSTFPKMFYGLRRYRNNSIVGEINGLRHDVHSSSSTREFDRLDSWLGPENRRILHFPNVQYGFSRGGTRPRLIDFGALQFLEDMNFDFALRAANCAFQLAKIDRAPFEQCARQAAPMYAALNAVLSRYVDIWVGKMRDSGISVCVEEHSSLGLICEGIAQDFDLNGHLPEEHVDALVEDLVKAALPFVE